MRHIILCISFLMFLSGSVNNLTAAEQHRATHLGNPATRFAPPLYKVEDLRNRFRDPKLRPDFAEILRQWGWKGRVEDLMQAGLTSEVREASIPVGSTMPFMSSRKGGKPICLRNVLWAGKEPAPAYAFPFKSNGRTYRCVVPKACSNFYVEDLGAEPVPGLTIECTLPSIAFLNRPATVCLIVRNPGTAPLAGGTVRLPIPQGAKVTGLNPTGTVSTEEATWQLATLMPKGEQRFYAHVVTAEPTLLKFSSEATGAGVAPARSSCEIKVIGIPAILIDTIDLEDPIQVGQNVTYEIKVTNQGSAEATNVRLRFEIPSQEEFVSGDGATSIGSVDVIQTEPLPTLAPNAAATWRVIVKAREAGDVRFKVQLTSDQFQVPINEEESTMLY